MDAFKFKQKQQMGKLKVVLCDQVSEGCGLTKKINFLVSNKQAQRELLVHPKLQHLLEQGKLDSLLVINQRARGGRSFALGREVPTPSALVSFLDFLEMFHFYSKPNTSYSASDFVLNQGTEDSMFLFIDWDRDDCKLWCFNVGDDISLSASDLESFTRDGIPKAYASALCSQITELIKWAVSVSLIPVHEIVFCYPKSGRRSAGGTFYLGFCDSKVYNDSICNYDCKGASGECALIIMQKE